MNGDRPLIFIDVETRSRVDIEARGGRLYAEDPSTELLCGVAVVVWPDGSSGVYPWAPWPGPIGDPRQLWSPWPGRSAMSPQWAAVTLNSDDPPEPVIRAIDAGGTLIAYNAHGFDRHVWEGLGLPVGRGGWADALDRTRRRGLPGKLEKVASYLYGEGKDTGGRQLMLKHSLPKKARPGQPEGVFLDPSGPALASIIRYCARDAMLLAAIWLDERLGDPHPDDLVLAAHERVMDRGVPIDLELARRLALVEAAEAREAEARALAWGVGATLLRASGGLRAWFRARGHDLPDVTGNTIEDLLARPDLTDEVRDVAEARLAVARVAQSKLNALDQRVSPDLRYRDWAAYWGAGTGRWAGRGVQLQNFPRPIVEGFPAEVAVDKILAARGDPEAVTQAVRQVVRQYAEHYEVRPGDVVATLLRSVVCAPDGYRLLILDWSAIEARGLLWLADDTEGLRVYIEGRDPYKVEAAALYGVPEADVTKTQRQAGKVAVLACGYQGGDGAVDRFAKEMRIDLAAAGIDPFRIVQGWRDAHPPVAGWRTGKTLERPDGKLIVLRKGGLWKALYRAAKRATEEGGEHEAGKCVFQRDGAHLVCWLPSGRPIVYRDAKMEPVLPRWGGEPRMRVTYFSPKGNGYRMPVYGGLLAENVTQAVCRDLLAEALVIMERAGLPNVLHVHDEMVNLVPEDVADEAFNIMKRIAETPPEWAAGFPLKTEGGVARRWGK